MLCLCWKNMTVMAPFHHVKGEWMGRPFMHIFSAIRGWNLRPGSLLTKF